ncbi:sushi, von Willebrand factor type a, egf and pentraxin domain-containing protein 1 [Plakobranchus ocellatus]|uniref:Sushi, von Willebrand factor type a, egf and pentraxin domain-containing protein 1 n=1 Tax=Plakobranchus ocellatus TaxID=259542 RepID=A0AAV4C8J2_9GAST|nr:sushi, von Willebrand factor type a, egf and pentraxin domain-containing protein 1 [Plakobranchus ocellatus]
MCWLFRACSSVTFKVEQQRCLLFQMGADHGVYRTVRQIGCLSVNMREVRKRPPAKRSSLIKLVREDPPHIPNSEAHSDGVSSIVYTCAHGYFRRGTSHITTCDRNTGAWSGVDVTCTFVDCGDPPFLHGAMAKGSSRVVNSEVTYSCLTGSAPSVSQIKVKCDGETGQWSSLYGSCAVVNCGQPKTVDNMDVELTPRSTRGSFPGLVSPKIETTYGGEAVYTCTAGYTPPKGSSFISYCQADGTWSSTANFRCNPVDCGAPPHVARSSHINYETTLYGENATAMCLPGHSPLSGVTLTCDETGTWTSSGQSCEPIDCGEPDRIENAAVHFNSTELNSVARHECIEPAVVEGGEVNATSTCDENGHWSAVSIACIAVPCGNAPPLTNGGVIYNTTEGSFKAFYTCDAGFMFASDATERLCMPDVNMWSKDNIICIGVECGAAPNVSHAIVTGTDYRYPSQVTYTCDRGYSLTSSASTRTCKQDGSWSQEDVMCELVVCDPPTLPEFTVLSPDAVNSHATERLCMPDANMWSKDKIICIGVECGAAPNVSHATVTGTDYRYPSQVTYTCDLGYSLRSSASTRTCKQDGSWSQEDVMCEPVVCDPPTLPAFTVLSPDAVNSLTSYVHGDSVTFSCQDNHISIPASSESLKNTSIFVTCDEGNWTMKDRREPSLFCIACNVPPNVNHSTWEIPTERPVKVQYTCESGYVFPAKNTDNLTCMENTRSWSGFGDVHCEPVDCGEPQTAANATFTKTGSRYKDTVGYNCSLGYRGVSGDQQRTCDEHGNWTGELIVCQEWNCESPPLLSSAHISYTETGFQSSAVYSCEAGFAFQSFTAIGAVPETSLSENVTCNENREWVNAEGKFARDLYCEEIKCPQAPDIANAKLLGKNIAPFTVNTTIHYTCLQGYRLLGLDPVLTCDVDGSWSFPFFECLKIDCGYPRSEKDSRLSLNSGTGFGAVAEYTCESGYIQISQANTRTCLSNGLWSREFIECALEESRHCRDPPVIENAISETISSQIGGIAIYRCLDGYRHFFTNAFLCYPGFLSWISFPDVQCVPIECGDPPFVENSYAIYENTSFGSKVFYRCRSDMVSPHGDSYECTSEGKWTTEPLVECLSSKTITCGSPSIIENSVRTYTSTTLGSTINYICGEGFTGEPFEAECEDDGLWKLKGSHGCIPVNCKNPPMVENTVINHISGTMYGDAAKYECLLGYVHTASSLKTCEANAEWSANIVECVPENATFCSEPPLRDNSVFTYHSRATGASAYYSCVEGFTISNASSDCNANGVWSEPYIVCNPIYCNNPPSLQNAYTFPDEPNIQFGISIIHICMQGFTSSTGLPLTSTCLENGSWSHIDGSCEPVVVNMNEVCTEDAPDIPNTHVISQAGTYVGASVKYSCNTAYFPVPHFDFLFHACLKGGTWSTTFFKCMPTWCIKDPPPPIPNTEMVGLVPSTYSFHIVTAVYNCITGHSVDGRPGLADGNNTSPGTLRCDLYIGWDSDSQTILECVPFQCGTPTLSEEHQVLTEDFNTTEESRIKIGCRRPWHFEKPDTFLQNEIVCQANGTWSYDDLLVPCNLCIQDNDVFNILNGYLDINVQDGEIAGDTGSIVCDDDYVRGGNASASCSLVDGNLTWLLEDEQVRCSRAYWKSPEKGKSDDLLVPIYMDIVRDGLRACVNITTEKEIRTSYKLKVTLQEGDGDSRYAAARVTSKIDPPSLVFGYRKSVEQNIFVTVAGLSEPLLQLDETGNICIDLDIPTLQYKLIKNGEIVTKMAVKRYKTIDFLKVLSTGTVNEVRIHYR